MFIVIFSLATTSFFNVDSFSTIKVPFNWAPFVTVNVSLTNAVLSTTKSWFKFILPNTFRFCFNVDSFSTIKVSFNWAPFVTVNVSFTNAFLSTTKSLFKFILPNTLRFCFNVDSLFTTKSLFTTTLFNTFIFLFTVKLWWINVSSVSSIPPKFFQALLPP